MVGRNQEQRSVEGGGASLHQASLVNGLNPLAAVGLDAVLWSMRPMAPDEEDRSPAHGISCSIMGMNAVLVRALNKCSSDYSNVRC